MRATAWVVAGVIGVAGAGLSAAELHEGPPTATVRTVATPQATVDSITVEMTAATLADDCGHGIVPTSPPVQDPPNPKKRSEYAPERGDSSARHGARARRQCEQTSMQLSVISPMGNARTTLRVKSVEIFDEHGVRVGKLTPRSPTFWSNSTYQTWDETVAPGQSLSVSYALTQPDWAGVVERWNKTFVVKAVVTIGGSDRTVERDVYVAAETSLPPNVRT